MTYVFLTRTFLTNPGYLPQWLRDRTLEDHDEIDRILRVYNMRLWAANKIYSFEEFVEKADNEGQLDGRSYEN